MPDTRAIVAISEDRRWLVVLETQDRMTHDGPQRFWQAFERVEEYYAPEDNVPDIGQDANEVLEQFLEERK